MTGPAATNPVALGLIVSGLPQPLLCPEQNPGWQAIRDGYARAKAALDAVDPDVLVVYSTMWPSILGHQVQALPTLEWVHVDELFHDLGSIPYRFEIDAALAHAVVDAGRGRGLQIRATAYHGFPVDTGSVVALRLLDPDGARRSIILSSNVYADRAETVVYAKALVDALRAQGKTAAAVCVTSLSNRLHTRFIAPEDDRIHSQKDEEWNQKLLEFLAEGRLEDTAQLSRTIHAQIRVHKVVNFKSLWWLSTVMGAHNRYRGEVLAYAPVYGTGAAVVALTPDASGAGDREFDEADVEVYRGDRHVLDRSRAQSTGVGPAAASKPARAGAAVVESIPEGEPEGALRAEAAPLPVGPYPHARRVGELLFLSGIGPRQANTDAIPGGPTRDLDGAPLDYDVYAQTEAVLDNVRVILEAAGSSLDRIVDVQVFLIDMDRDFEAFNRAYTQRMAGIGATRTTIAVRALPTPIAVEMKVVALVEPTASRA